MPKFCDKSPCIPLMDALGNYIKGTEQGFIMIVKDSIVGTKSVRIDYCPFCGTRIEQIPEVPLV